MDFDSLKEASWCPEYNAKNLSSFQLNVSEKKQEKSSTITFLFAILAKNDHFLRFFLIFLEMILFKALRFFSLTSVHKDALLELSKSNIGQLFRFLYPKGMTSGTTREHAHKWFVKSVKIYITLAAAPITVICILCSFFFWVIKNLALSVISDLPTFSDYFFLQYLVMWSKVANCWVKLSDITGWDTRPSTASSPSSISSTTTFPKSGTTLDWQRYRFKLAQDQV